MSLPTSRNRTYALGDDVVHTDLNDIMDCIVGGKHGELPIYGNWNYNGTTNPGAAFNAITGSWDSVGANGWDAWCVPELPEGARLHSCSVYAQDANGTADFTLRLYVGHRNPNTSPVMIDELAVVNQSSAWTLRQIPTTNLPRVLAADEFFYFTVLTLTGAAALRLGPPRFRVDKP